MSDLDIVVADHKRHAAKDLLGYVQWMETFCARIRRHVAAGQRADGGASTTTEGLFQSIGRWNTLIETEQMLKMGALHAEPHFPHHVTAELRNKLAVVDLLLQTELDGLDGGAVRDSVQAIAEILETLRQLDLKRMAMRDRLTQALRGCETCCLDDAADFQTVLDTLMHAIGDVA